MFGPLLLKAATPHQSGLGFGKGKPTLHVSAELLPLKNQPAVTFLHEGDVLRAGPYAFEVLETPGHDPWPVSYTHLLHTFAASAPCGFGRRLRVQKPRVV